MNKKQPYKPGDRVTVRTGMHVNACGEVIRREGSAWIVRLNDRPIDHEFSAEVVQIARDGYRAFCRRRHGARPWEQLHGLEQFRWKLAAELVWDRGDEVTARQIRDRYHTHTDQPSWDDVNQSYRSVWRDVAIAMQRSRDGIHAQQRMVISG